MSNTVLAGLVAIACVVVMDISTCIKNKFVKSIVMWVTLGVFLVAIVYAMNDLWFDNFPRWLRNFFPES